MSNNSTTSSNRRNTLSPRDTLYDDDSAQDNSSLSLEDYEKYFNKNLNLHFELFLLLFFGFKHTLLHLRSTCIT